MTGKSGEAAGIGRIRDDFSRRQNQPVSIGGPASLQGGIVLEGIMLDGGMLDGVRGGDASLFDPIRFDKDGLTTDAHIRRMLQIVRTHLDMDVGFVSEFVDGRRVFRQVDARVASPVKEGGSDPLEESFCQRVADGRLPQLMPDAAKDSVAAAMSAMKDVPVGAHMSVPLKLRDGRVFGSFCCFSFKPNLSLNTRDLRIMRAFAAIVADFIHEELEIEREAELKRERIEWTLAQASLRA